MIKPTSYADIPILPQKWNWPGRLPNNRLVVAVGPEGIGKSFLGANWVACLTRGTPWPDGTGGGNPVNVLMITPEDDRNRAMAPRLVAAGADLTRVFDFTRESMDGLSIPAIKQRMKEIGNVGLVWIDPLSSVSAIPLTSSNSRVRRMIVNPLDLDLAMGEWDEEDEKPFATPNGEGCLVVAIVHDTKEGRVSGSKAITEAARVVLKITREMVGDDDIRRIHVHKSNISNDRIGDIAYTLVDPWPNTRVRYYEVPEGSVGEEEDVRKVPVRELIVAVLTASDRAMETPEIWEEIIETHPEVKYESVRTALHRLGKDRFSRVYSPNKGWWWIRREQEDGPIIGLRPL